MTDVKNQEHLRDTIGNVLEMSRASWKLKRRQKEDDKAATEGDFPQSMVIKTLVSHPLAVAAVIATLFYVGPARFGALAFTGASLLLRHRVSIMPLAEQLLTSNFFKSKKKPIHQPSSD